MTETKYILTRYLYSFIDVRQSLFLNILDRKYKEALYWAYELYWSGYTEDTFEHLLETYEIMFIIDEELFKRLKEEYNAWRLDNSLYEKLGTIVINLCFQPYKISKFVDKFFNIKCEEIDNNKDICKLYVNLNKKDVDNYCIDYSNENSRWKILKMEYRYKLRTEYREKVFQIKYININDRREMLLKNWEYYAYDCPYWRDLIDRYEGKIENENVIFESDDMLEEFYNNYSYEIDEQSLEIQNIALGETNEKEHTMKEFVEKYNGKILTKKIKKRININ